MSVPIEPAEVLFAGRLSAGEVTELRDAFATVGLAIDLREVSARRGLGDIAWLALLAVPLKPFYEQLLNDFADDAHQQLKKLAGKLLHRRRLPGAGDRQVLVLQDSATGVQVVLEPDLPDQAYQQLLRVDLTAIRQGPVHYDQHRHQWRSELDEADPTSSTPHGG